MIKLNSILKTRPYRSRTSFPRMFILKLEQDMKPDQLHKRDLKNSSLIYALIGTIFINCLLMFSYVDTKSREFQYRILNRYLTTNSFLYKIGLANSPLCTFCKQESESLEHLLIICSCTKSFWSDFLTWSNQLNISLRDLSDSDILFGFWQRKEDYLFINHMLVLAKQHIYECRNKCTYPSFTIFLNKVSYVHQLEKKLMNSNNKVADQESKWEKFQLFCRGSEN